MVQLILFFLILMSHSGFGLAQSTSTDGAVEEDPSGELNFQHERFEKEKRADRGLLMSPPQKTTQEILPFQLGSAESLSKDSAIGAIGSPITTYNSGYFIRGANSEQSLLIWNGIELNDETSPGKAGDGNLMNREFSHRVSVIKGPQSLLYGSSAIGGIILVERDPSLNSSLQIMGGTHKTHQEKLEYQELQVNNMTYLGGQNFQTEGVSALSEPVTQERDARSAQSLSLIVDYILPDRDKATGLISYYQGENRDDVPPLDDSNAKSYYRSLDASISSHSSFSVNMESDLMLSYSKRERQNLNLADDLSPDFYDDVSRAKALQIKNINKMNTDFGTIRFGLDFHHSELNSESLDSGLGIDLYSEQLNQLGLLFLHDFSMDRWSLAYGLRYEMARQRDVDGSQGSLVYQTMVQWDGDGFSPYGSLGSGFKYPSLTQRYSHFGSLSLLPEKSINQEVGLKWKNGSLYGQGSVFESHFTELIQFDLATGKYSNLSATSNKGVELAVEYELRNGDLGVLNSSLAQIYVKNSSDGSYLLRRPVYRGHVGYKNFFLKDFEFFLEENFIGEREDFYLQPRRMASYLKTDVGGVWHRQREEVFVRLYNLLNTAYEEIAGYNSAGRMIFIGLNRTL